MIGLCRLTLSGIDSARIALMKGTIMGDESSPSCLYAKISSSLVVAPPAASISNIDLIALATSSGFRSYSYFQYPFTLLTPIFIPLNRATRGSQWRPFTFVVGSLKALLNAVSFSCQ